MCSKSNYVQGILTLISFAKFWRYLDENGITTYNNVELAKRLNISPATVSRMDTSLINKELLDINTLTQRDQETGLPIKQKVFHLNKLQQAIIFILGNHEQRIQNNENSEKYYPDDYAFHDFV